MTHRPVTDELISAASAVAPQSAQSIPPQSRAATTCRLLFWSGVFLALCGQVVTFVPGAALGWFLISAALIASGVFVPKRSYRLAAIAGCALCLLAAYAGYLHGLEYEAWPRSR